MAKTAYPRFTPARTIKHDILGTVRVYEFKKSPCSDANGAQTDFYTNGAEVNNARQYGIKLFSTSIEAFAAFERQRAAAKKGFAPPVGTMIQWKVGRWSRWGYQTCLADCSDNAKDVIKVIAFPKTKKEFAAWQKSNNKIGSVFTLAKEFIGLTRAGYDAIDKAYDKAYKACPGLYLFDTPDERKKAKFDEIMNNELANNPIVMRHHRNGNWMPRFNAGDNYMDDDSKDCSLARGLRSISVAGMQYDNLWDLHDDGNYSFACDRRLELGSVFCTSDECTLGNDLHSGNIGLWRNKPVCIDFGFHCVVNPAISLD